MQSVVSLLTFRSVRADLPYTPGSTMDVLGGLSAQSLTGRDASNFLMDPFPVGSGLTCATYAAT